MADRRRRSIKARGDRSACTARTMIGRSAGRRRGLLRVRTSGLDRRMPERTSCQLFGGDIHAK